MVKSYLKDVLKASHYSVKEPLKDQRSKASKGLLVCERGVSVDRFKPGRNLTRFDGHDFHPLYGSKWDYNL